MLALVKSQSFRIFIHLIFLVGKSAAHLNALIIHETVASNLRICYKIKYILGLEFKMDELIELFEECEDARHKSEIESNPEFFDPPRGINYYKFYHERFLEKVKNHKFGGTNATGENLDAIKNNGLTIEEASVIYMYTHHHIYENLNYFLRNHIDKLDRDQKVYIKLLNSALNKLDSFNDSTIYRDIRKPEDGAEKWLNYYEQNIGNVIKFNDFLSCHTDDVRISDEETDYQFVIKTSDNSNGKDIKNITLIQIENEVLFKNGTDFLIGKVDKENNQVFMKEI